jgi:hypothetical protein
VDCASPARYSSLHHVERAFGQVHYGRFEEAETRRSPGVCGGSPAKRRVFGTVAPEVTELPTGPALRYNNVTEKDMARKLPGAA